MEEEYYSVNVEKNVACKMRDGVSLMCSIYTPITTEYKKFPAILLRTAYGRDFRYAHTEHLYFPQRGFIVVCQDVRGRHESEGEFYPARNEAEDGYDSIEWVAKLPQCNGSVGTAGQSYLGLVQVCANSEAPPSLKASCIVSPVTFITKAFYRNGALLLNWAIRYLDTLGYDYLQKQGVSTKSLDDHYDVPFYHNIAKLGLGLIGQSNLSDFLNFNYNLNKTFINQYPIDKISNSYPPEFTLAHDILNPKIQSDEKDKFGNKRVFSNIQNMAKIPTLLVSAWYDCFLEDTLLLYSIMSKVEGSKKKLIIGPWDHMTPFTTPTTKCGDVDFGPQAAISIHEYQLKWFNKYLKGMEIEEEMNGVKMFTMGTNVWREESTFPPPDSKSRKLYLSKTNLDSKLTIDKQLEDTQTHSTFVSNHEDLVPGIGGNVATFDRGARDHSFLIKRKDVLCFQTSELTEPLELTGYIQATISHNADTNNYDIVLILADQHPSGFVQNLVEGVTRFELEGKVSESVKTHYIDMFSTSHVVLPGHKLLLFIAASSFPKYDKNSENNATINIYHSNEYPSFVQVLG